MIKSFFVKGVFMLRLFFLSLGIVFLLGCGGSDDRSANALTQQAQGGLSGVRYICVGDSTRSIADSPKLFERLSAALNRHGVSSYLVAKSGYKLSEFVSDNGGETNYKKVIDNVSNDGKNTIVDISLSINDLWDFATPEDEKESIQNRLKSDLIRAMNLIKAKKPKTIFIFTSSNPMQMWDEGTEIYMEVYRELSSELKIPFIDYYDNIFVYFDSAQKQKMYRNGGIDNIHYSDFGQLEMADYIIEQLGL
jgi:lysophospholipase L1-like esterase